MNAALNHGVIIFFYLNPRSIGMRSREGFIMRNFIVFNVHLILSRSLSRESHVVRIEEDRNAFKILTGRDLYEA